MRRALWLETLSFGLLIVLAATLVWQVGANHNLARQGQQAHEALCVFKADLGSRIISSQRFLESHPGGVGGFSAADLRGSQDARIATFNSLGTLTCVQKGTP